MSGYYEEQVSGAIWAEASKYNQEGEKYSIRINPFGQSWGLPVESIQPADLRALADRIEERRRGTE